MHSRNVVALVGHLTAEPVLKQTPGGDPILEFGVAVNRSNRRPDGGWEDSLDGYFDCELFGRAAEAAAAQLHKGTHVQVSGSLIQNRFETAGGQKVSKVLVRAKTVSVVVDPPKSQTAAVPANGQPVAVPA
jgi:single-strand DNA-binding protein